MIITLTNVIGAIRTSISVVTTNLKMWLGFETSETLGREDVVDGDFPLGTSAWDNVSETGGSITLENGFLGLTTGANNLQEGWAQQVLTLESGKTYEAKITNIGRLAMQVGTSNKGFQTFYKDFVNDDTHTVSFTTTTNTVYLNFRNFDNTNATSKLTNVSVRELTQITPDKSGNNNVGELFTGKALEFDGAGDIVDFTSFTTPIKCAVFWVKPLSTGIESILGFGGAYAGAKYIKSSNNNIITQGLNSVLVYVNNVQTTSVPLNQWSRVVVNFALKTPQDLTFGYGFDTYGYIQLSDVQLYNENLTTDDIAYDYANPQNLVTDRSGPSIALSNLKGYWALSEGAGSLAYDSSGEGNNGTINGATYELSQPRIPQLGMVNWSKGSNLFPFSEDFENSEWTKNVGTTITNNYATSPNGDLSAARYLGTGTSGLGDKFTLSAVSYTLSFYVKSNTGQTQACRLVGDSTNVSGDFSVTTDWNRISYTFTGSGGVDKTNGIFRDSSDNDIDILIWGAQLEQSSSVGAYRLTDGGATSNSTVIPKPTIPTQDIFGNLVRDRLNSFNLDGSGYAEVADDASINPTTEITVQCWIQSNTETNRGLVAKWDSSVKDYMLLKSGTIFRFYIGTDFLESGTIPTSGWVNIAGTYDGSNIKTYINGVLSTTIARTGSIPNNSQTLDIGRYNRSLGVPYSERISDVLLYDTALDANEIENNYNAGLSAHTN